MHATVALSENDVTYDVVAPPRRFDHLFRNNWWCGFNDRLAPDQRGIAGGDWIGLLYPGKRLPFPAFISDTERTQLDEELTSHRGDRQRAKLSHIRSHPVGAVTAERS